MKGISTRSVSADCCLEEHVAQERTYTLRWITLLLLSPILCALRVTASWCIESMPYKTCSRVSPICSYVLTNQVVPPDRILGVWSLINNSWIQKPIPAEFARLNDPQSDIDLVMHIAHQQQYCLKRQENDRNRITWSRKQYLDHVLEYLTNSDIMSTRFLLHGDHTRKCQGLQDNLLQIQMRGNSMNQMKKTRDAKSPRKKSSNIFKSAVQEELKHRKEPTNSLRVKEHQQTLGMTPIVTHQYK